MHISSIRITNFRSFAQLEVHELPPALVILGENNTGKSNLVHALRLVLDPSLSDRQRELAAEDFHVGCEAPLAGDEITVAVELSGFDDDRRVKAALRDSCVRDGPLTARLTYVFRPAPGSEPSDGDYEFRVFGGEDEGNELTPGRRRELALTVLPALRDAEADLRHSRRSPLNELVEFADLDEAIVADAAQKVRDANERLLEDEGLARLERDLGRQVEDLVGSEHGVTVSLGVSTPVPAELLRTLVLLVEDGFPLRRTGLGAANVLYLALLLRRLRARQEDSRTAASVLAVEEPEAHLHPHVQRALFNYLLSHTSVIVTTHSAHIASVSTLPSIVVLRREGDATVARRASAPAMTEQQRADVERYLDVNRADILFARGVILVEGAAEQYLVPVVARDAGIELDRLGITVFSVEGIDFTPYRMLLNALAIPNVVVTDGDPNAEGMLRGVGRGVALLGEEAREEAEELEEVDDRVALLAREGIFVNESTLELEYAQLVPDAVLAAHHELIPESSVLRKRNFETALAAIGDDCDKPAGGRLVRRIETIGKGRFAQRFAAHAEGGSHPEYLTEAARKLAEMLSG